MLADSIVVPPTLGWTLSPKGAVEVAPVAAAIVAAGMLQNGATPEEAGVPVADGGSEALAKLKGPVLGIDVAADEATGAVLIVVAALNTEVPKATELAGDPGPEL